MLHGHPSLSTLQARLCMTFDGDFRYFWFGFTREKMKRGRVWLSLCCIVHIRYHCLVNFIFVKNICSLCRDSGTRAVIATGTAEYADG